MADRCVCSSVEYEAQLTRNYVLMPDVSTVVTCVSASEGSEVSVNQWDVGYGKSMEGLTVDRLVIT